MDIKWKYLNKITNTYLLSPIVYLAKRNETLVSAESIIVHANIFYLLVTMIKMWLWHQQKSTTKKCLTMSPDCCRLQKHLLNLNSVNTRYKYIVHLLVMNSKEGSFKLLFFHLSIYYSWHVIMIFFNTLAILYFIFRANPDNIYKLQIFNVNPP